MSKFAERKGDSVKPRLHLNQYGKEIQELECEIWQTGVEKYEEGQWLKGRPLMSGIASLTRHLNDFINGQDYDLESGKSQVGHIICCAKIVAQAWVKAQEDSAFDDRPAHVTGRVVPKATTHTLVESTAIKLGQVWRTRDGNEVKVIRELPNSIDRFQVQYTNSPLVYWVTEEGSATRTDKRHPKDLVGLLMDTLATDVLAQDENCPWGGLGLKMPIVETEAATNPHVGQTWGDDDVLYLIIKYKSEDGKTFFKLRDSDDPEDEGYWWDQDSIIKDLTLVQDAVKV